MSQYSLSVLCHIVALADCIRSGYVGGQLVITRKTFVLLLFTIKKEVTSIYWEVSCSNVEQSLL